MTTIISMFNHKGGVSKTTTVFNLAWRLAKSGKRVIMVDADPQCNLTGVVQGLNPIWSDGEFAEVSDTQEREYAEVQDRVESEWAGIEDKSLYEALRPAFESEPRLMEPVECIPVDGCSGLFLLPGSLRLGEYDVTLSVASELSSSLLSFKNVPGAANYLLRTTADAIDADYVIVDMNPSLGALNQNLVCISDLLIVPTAPDYFSVMALRSLAQILPRWIRWAKRASKNEILRSASYPFPEPKLKLAGVVIQRYRLYKSPTEDNLYGTPSGSFAAWIERVSKAVSENFVPSLRDAGMLFDEDEYKRAGVPSSLVLARIQEFNSLLPKSQEYRVPVYELTDKQLRQAGVVLDASKKQIRSLSRIFEEFASRVIKLNG
ncbi:AAA family ATPase [Actinomyces sp. ZJ308]|uniref:ParA family protein n=1 Tax=Actinomyces sp. ZJ308 TaxID=2708342 RepID=UPI001422D49F|nr:AAA family ATPase [Actinomyces sp. ZJ308]